jgi:hypothetical protein
LLCTLLVNDPSAQPAALDLIRDAYAIGDVAVTPPELIVERL